MVIHTPVGVACVGGDFVAWGQWRTAKRKQRFAVRSRALLQLPRSFARSSDKIAGHAGYSRGRKTVSSVSTFSCHMYSGLNKEALFSAVWSKNDRFSKKKTQH